jgi:hypothetical protein
MLQMKRSKRKIEEIRKVQQFADLDRLDDYTHYQEIARKLLKISRKWLGVLDIPCLVC